MCFGIMCSLKLHTHTNTRWPAPYTKLAISLLIHVFACAHVCVCACVLDRAWLSRGLSLPPLLYSETFVKDPSLAWDMRSLDLVGLGLGHLQSLSEQSPSSQVASSSRLSRQSC